MTYAAINMHAVPTSWSLALCTDMKERNRSMKLTAKNRVSVWSRYSSATSTNQSTRMDRMVKVMSGCLVM